MAPQPLPLLSLTWLPNQAVFRSLQGTGLSFIVRLTDY
jgi:hypothetical protein